MTATLVQVAGILLLAVGAGMMMPALGVIVAGVGVTAFGLALERRG